MSDDAPELKRTLTPTQRAFATSREPFPAFVGGYGSGKSAAAIARAMALKAHFPKNDVAYYLPTYPLVEDIAFQRFPELCERKGWQYKLRKSGGTPAIEFPGSGRILFRTMENPDRIVGYEVAHSILDEIDTLDTIKARKVWNKVIARNRQKMPGGFPNTVGVATTPEGFKFVWEQWEKVKRPGYVLFRAKTMDNAAHLPADYIENLRNSYPSQLLTAYLDGEFVNMTSGSVYPNFSRVKNNTTETIQDGEALHIGMDFNVTHMSGIVHTIRGNKPRALFEFTELFDTPAMCTAIRNKFPKEKHPSILVYPDASGNSRKSNNASQTDLSILRTAGFHVCVNPTNPAVKDRVLSMNKNFETADYLVNTDLCPLYVEGLEKQPYDKHGEPDKVGGLDHPVDAGGYFITYKFPVLSRKVVITTLRI